MFPIVLDFDFRRSSMILYVHYYDVDLKQQAIITLLYYYTQNGLIYETDTRKNFNVNWSYEFEHQHKNLSI